MYRIAICDDEAAFSALVQEMSEEILNEAHIAHNITRFSTAQSLLDACRQADTQFDLLLLDILLGDGNGVALARRLRKTGYKASIAFLTSCMDYAVEGYEVSAVRYLLKPVDREKLRELLIDDYTRSVRETYLIFSKGAQRIRVPAGSIRYLESLGHRVVIHTAHGELDRNGRLQDLEEQLPAGQFIRCHQSYLVSLAEIRMLQKGSVCLRDGTCIPVSKRCLPKVREAFYTYLKP